MALKKQYKVVKNLPDNLGAISVVGRIIVAGDPLPPNIPQAAIKDCLDRELIEEVGTAVIKKRKAPSAISVRGLLRPVSKWKIDPADLSGKSLKEVNIMILEKDPDAEPFDSLDDAVEQLSKDFEE